MPVEFDSYVDSKGDNEIDWTLREGSNAHTILSFLSEHPDQGFTPKEITEATDVPSGSVGKTLKRLEERQLVRHEEPYWAFGDDDRVGTYLGMLSSLETITDREATEDLDDWRAVNEDE